MTLKRPSRNMASTLPKLTLHSFSFEDIKIGSTYSFERFIDAESVELFASLSGDYNPLHMDEAYAAHAQFGSRVAHGMLLASFFSTLVGMLMPGLRCLYLSQEVRFKKPVFLDTQVVIKGTVTEKSDAAKIIVLRTMIMDNKGIVFVEGEAKVHIRHE